MLHFNELTNSDIKILEFVYNSPNKKTSIESICVLFDNPTSTSFRIKQLAKATSNFRSEPDDVQYLDYVYEEYEDEIGISHVNRLDIVTITPLGIKTIEDYNSNLKAKRREKYEDRFWKACPITIALMALYVSIVTFLHSIGILHIEQWYLVKLLLKATTQ